MAALNLMDLTEQLYAAKMFIVIITLFNVFLNIFSMYILMTSGLWIFALLSSIVLVFNILFMATSVGHWRKKETFKGDFQ